MVPSKVRFSSFPRTEPPPAFTEKIINVFQAHEPLVCTMTLEKGLTSDAVLAELRADLSGLGFAVELGKTSGARIKRPVFFGENGAPDLQYEIDAFHAEWRCGLEIEAGRAWMGNAVYRDLIQALVMVELEHLILAVPMAYKYMSANRAT